MSINGPQMTLRHDHCHDKVWECAWSGLLYMGLARVIRAGWAPRNHCWVTGCLTTSLKCGTDHYSVWPTPVMYKYRYMCQAQPTLLSLPNPCQVQVLKYKYQVQPT